MISREKYLSWKKNLSYFDRTNTFRIHFQVKFVWIRKEKGYETRQHVNSFKSLKDSKKSAKHREDNSQIVLAVINGVGSIVSTRNCCIIVSPIGVGFLVRWNLESYLTWKNCLYGHSNWQKRSEKIRNKPTERRTDMKKKESVQYSC